MFIFIFFPAYFKLELSMKYSEVLDFDGFRISVTTDG